MKPVFYLLICLSSVFTQTLNGQDFSRFFVFGPSNPFAGTSFITSHELHDSTGFLILGDKYTTHRNGFVIKTDNNLNEIWTTTLNFQNAQFPYDNIGFYDIGELLNGNIYVYGVAGPGGTSPHAVLFILDTAGNVINYTALHDSLGVLNGANLNSVRLGEDSTILLPISTYEEFGYYRLDQQLNLLSNATYAAPNVNNSRGRDCIMLHDSTILLHSSTGLTKTDVNGNVLWSKEYTGITQFFSVYESVSGSIYASANASPNGANAAIAKFDSAGNPVFLRIYTMAAASSTSPAWCVYEHGNDLMVYSDSVMFRIDTNGNVIGMGKTVNAYNNKVMNPALNHKFLLTGQIMQDSTGMYEYSLMKFDDSTQSGCLHPRAIITATSTMTATTVVPSRPATHIVEDTINFVANPVNLDFDALNGCPPNPLSVMENGNHPLPVIFPNPASAMVLVQTLAPEQTVSIYNSFGQLMLEQRSGNESTLAIDVASWSDGLYHVVAGASAIAFVVAH